MKRWNRFKQALGGVLLALTSLAGHAADTTVWESKVYYIQNDHLGTPKAVTDSSDRVVWRNEGEPFGNTLPDEDPDGDGKAFTLNLRFPGQYYDQETQRNQNFFRDYNPETGRYIQSDPIGLRGGVNTFAYVSGNPVTAYDPTGELAFLMIPGICAAGGCEAGLAGLVTLMSPTGQKAIKNAVNAIKNACTSDNPDPCDEIRRQIRDIQAKLAKKEEQLAKDPYDLFNRAYSVNPGGDLAGKGTYHGHITQIEGLRVGLARKIAEAKAMGCL